MSIVRSLVFAGLIAALLGSGGCDRTPEEVYAPPNFAGTAYVVADADHLTVLDLGTTALSRIDLDRPVVDIDKAGDTIYLLAADGTLLRLDPGRRRLQTVDRPLTDGLAMDNDGAGGLWLLSSTELCQWQPGTGIAKRFPRPADATTIFYDGERQRLVLVDRTSNTLTVFDPATLQVEKTIAGIGNSVHQGLAMPGTTEYWIAEGNEYRNGEPYGVGYAKDHPAMPGGINVIDLTSASQTDFIMVGGNVVDLELGADGKEVFVATSQRPEYIEATLAAVDVAKRRTRAEYRLCDGCHLKTNVDTGRERLLVRGVAIDFQYHGPETNR